MFPTVNAVNLGSAAPSRNDKDVFQLDGVIVGIVDLVVEWAIASTLPRPGSTRSVSAVTKNVARWFAD